MHCGQFFLLLRESYRMWAEEQFAAITAACFPHMEKRDRERMTTRLKGLLKTSGESGDDSTEVDDRARLEAFRAMTKAGANRAL